ncbi:hypothetical protein GGH19_003767 [Coemansia sp. RSA 1807]|nr:hypothetical protein GGF48_001881 [Coemansia sp. RSA 921]KAJ2267225.1 hypothetical protein EV176_005332 [Coemansia sp. RSA 451]KAJ2528882.1 hypothetical protein GGH20_002454 [Coemansia sp. RSA 1937]KAJ2574491.1 hypothetical protein GGH19_003767 [Coemansia sp. RSA 1807]
MWDTSSPPFKARNGAYDEYDSFDEHESREPATPLNTYGGIRQMEQTSLTSARARNASTNPYATLHHINRELMELGLPSPLMLPELSECLEDNQRVVECLVLLLQQRKKDLQFRDIMEDELRKAMGEEDQLRSTITRLERDVDLAQREAAMTRIKLEDSQRTLGDVDGQRKQLAADLRTTRSNAAMVRAQHVHDGKKREQEMNKLKDRLQKLITDKHRAAKLSVELVNAVERDRSGRVVENRVARDRKLLEELIGKYEATEVELIAKIEALEEMVRRLMRAMNRLHGDVVTGDDAKASKSVDEAQPIDAGVEQSLELLDGIRTSVHAERNKPVHRVDPTELNRRDEQILVLQSEITTQQREITNLKKVLDEQRQMIDRVSHSQASRHDPLEMSFSEMSLEQLDAERDEVRRERQQLEEERRRFTDAAIELGNERSELKRERDSFERERTMQNTHDVVSGLPPTPQWMKGLDTTQATPMILSQLQSMYNGTPTNVMLASMAGAYNAAMDTVGGQSSYDVSAGDAEARETESPRTLDDEFPELSPSDPMTSQRTTVRPPRSTSRTAHTPHYSTRTESRTPHGSTRTPIRPTRTPIDVRSGRQARVCTRPGCAAHAPHSHDDGTPAHVMELKPPVPRFRRKQESADNVTARSRTSDIYK